MTFKRGLKDQNGLQIKFKKKGRNKKRKKRKAIFTDVFTLTHLLYPHF